MAQSRSEAILENMLGASNVVDPKTRLEKLLVQVGEKVDQAGAYGSPMKAATVAEMTDTNRVYVYTGSESGYTSGNWYYWNGTAWTSGGVYNAVAVDTDTTLTESGEAADAKATGDAISSLNSDISDFSDKLLSAFPTATVSGSIASFDDGADDIPVKDLTVSIEPVQSGSGDPSPSNVRPISGWDAVTVYRTGINQWDEEWEEGTIDANGNNSSNTSRWRAKNFISILPNTSYYFKGTKTGSGTATIRPRFYDINKVYIGNTSQSGTDIVANTAFTTPTDAYYMRFTPDKSGTYGILTDEVTINYPSTDTDYHAYTGQTDITLSLGDTYYGGTLDVTTGVLTVTHGYKAYTSCVSVSQSGSLYYAMFTLPSTSHASSASNPALVCNMAKDNGQSVVLGNCYCISNGVTVVAVLDQSYTTKALLDAYLAENPLQLVFELATATTVTLTATEVETLLGDNTIYADCGDVSVTYRADPILYINNVIASLS